MLKELVTNTFKHSRALHLNVTLIQKKGNVELIVQDDGIGISSINQTDMYLHKGLNSIREQLLLLKGAIIIESAMPSGLRVTIRLPMKGEDSYAYFVNR